MTDKSPTPPKPGAEKGQLPKIEGDAPGKAKSHETRKGDDANVRQNLTSQRSVQDR
jgi:hypothetical protein